MTTVATPRKSRLGCLTQLVLVALLCGVVGIGVVAVRDLELAVAAFVLAKLTEIRETSAVESSRGARVLRTEVA